MLDFTILATTTFMNRTTIFTDGSSRGNPGPGGWAAIVVNGDRVVELGGRDSHTTNNRMEMVAAIEACKNIESGTTAELHTDSSYLINGITKWVFGWQKNNWITSQKKDVENKDLWVRLIEVTKGKNISWKYVGGHVGVVGNERCDVIATSFADNKPEKLYNGELSGYLIKNILDVSHNPDTSKTKKASSTRSKAKAYSYISAINGDVKIHHSWADCESRVKGKKGARFKKALDAEEEAQIVGEFRRK